MPIAGARNLAWRPKGVTDTIDSTSTGLGSMAALANLVPDPSTRNVYVPRPAAVQYPGFSVGQGTVSVYLILGDTVYGMIANGQGYDIPFVYNLLDGNFTAVTGIDNSNIPATASLIGDWTPPTMDTLGAYVLVTHPGFTGAANGFFGWFDLTKPPSPVWHSGNLSINPLVAVPVGVAVYGGRAYYAVLNATQASDEFLPLQQTNANQVLTYGDSTPVTKIAGLPLNNTSGGIVQSLMVFKDVQQIYQLTGDYTGIPTAWAINTLNVATGTDAPNSVTSTPLGLTFIAPDGLRLIDFNSTVSDVIGEFGEGISTVFQRAPNRSRIVSAFNVQTLRVAVRQSETSPEDTVEYWFNFGLKAWTGPHSLPTVFMRSYKNTFVAAFVQNLAGIGVLGAYISSNGTLASSTGSLLVDT